MSDKATTWRRLSLLPLSWPAPTIRPHFVKASALVASTAIAMSLSQAGLMPAFRGHVAASSTRPAAQSFWQFDLAASRLPPLLRRGNPFCGVTSCAYNRLMSKTVDPGFGRRLREMRISRGLTQGELAMRAQMHVHAISKFEQGTREPVWSTLRRLAVALGVTCAEFETPTADPPPRRRGRPSKKPAPG